MLFDNWTSIWRVLLVGTLGYVALVVLLRVSGKRTLSKMNAFDLVVTIAIGSTFATVLLTKDVALAEGVVAFAVLVTLQFVVTWLSVRSGMVRRFVKAKPSLLLYQGELLYDALRQQRVTAGEVRSAVRAEGILRVEDVAAVVLETDGTLTVVRGGGAAGGQTGPERAPRDGYVGPALPPADRWSALRGVSGASDYPLPQGSNTPPGQEPSAASRR